MISNKIYTLFIVTIIAVIGIFYLLTIREGHNWGGDFSMYTHHAKNIAEGIDYKDTGYIYNPFYPSLSPETYPPVFPLLLAPVYKLFGLNFTAMKIEIILIFLASLFLIFLSFRNELPFQHVAALIIIIGFNPYFWNFKDNVLSDIPFLLWTYISLFFILRAYQSDKAQGIILRYSMYAGLFIYLSYGTRSIGLVLIPCLFIHDIIRHKRPTRFSIIATLIFVFFMVLQTIYLHSDRTYFEKFTFDFKIILFNIFSYVRSLSVLWDNGYNKIFKVALFIVTSTLATIGYVARIKNNVTILEIFLLLYVSIIIIVSAADQGARYLIPVIPLYIFYAFVGIMKIDFFLQYKKARKVFVITLIVAIFVSYFGNYTKMSYGSIHEGVGKKETIELFEYIRRNTDEGDIFIFRRPRVLSLFTGRSAAVYHRTRDDKDLWNFFHKIGATYLIAKNIDSDFLYLFVEKYEDLFEEVYTNLDFKVYKIKERKKIFKDITIDNIVKEIKKGLPE